MVEAGNTLASMELQAAYTMAREMLNSHGLHEWDLAYDRARRRAGLTNFTTGTISLSRPLTQLFSEEDVRETAGAQNVNVGESRQRRGLGWQSARHEHPLASGRIRPL